MSSNINLQSNEYNVLTTELKKVHEQIQANIESFLTKIEAVLVENDGFTDDMLKPKIEELVNTIRSEVLTNMEEIYKASEESVSTFIESVKILDIVGSY